MTWKKGQSGNPSGRPKIAKEIRELAKADAPEAYEIIAAVMRTAKEASTRASAADKVLKLAGCVPASAPDDDEEEVPSDAADATVLRALEGGKS